MHLILTGATGLVGSGVLDAMLGMREITRISILSRRPVPMAQDANDPRVKVIIHKDFAKYDADVLSQLEGAMGCVWALGISQTKVNKEEYNTITKTYALQAAEAFHSLPTADQPFRFVYVSGAGATTDPGRFSAVFARVKGETELALADLRRKYPQLQTSSVRPAFVDEANHAAVIKYLPPRPSYERIFRVTAPAIRAVAPGIWSPTYELGTFLAGMAMGKYDHGLQAGKDVQMLGAMPVLENSAFRRTMGLSS